MADYYSPLRIYKYNPMATIPRRSSIQAAGYDLFAAEDRVISKNCRAFIKTGIGLELPRGSCGLIKARSGMSVLHKCDIGAGVIDSDFRGEISVLLINNGDFDMRVRQGNKIAQMLVLTGLHQGDVQVVNILTPSARGTSWCGSTDINNERIEQ